MIKLSYDDLAVRAWEVMAGLLFRTRQRNRLYGVPNGGIHAAQVIYATCDSVSLVEAQEEADVIVDDIIDSGATRERYVSSGKPFVALVDKLGRDSSWAREWVSFPWERMRREDGPQDAVKRIIQFIGDDPNREGLLETPDRVVRAYGELFSGYKIDPASVLKTFKDGTCDEMVLLKNVEWHSHCEHHMLPFSGRAHIAYVPRGRIVGISKLARLLEVFARRLQVQERLTTQVTGALMEHLEPLGAACVLEASHSCMTCRGVNKQHSVMVTSSLTGVFRVPEVRAEFFGLVRGG